MLVFEGFPAHVRLMLLAARTKLRESERAEIERLCAGEVDWRGFVEVAAHHRVSSLVYETLDRVRPAGLPGNVRQQLQERARMNAFEAVRAAGEVGRIQERFARAGIEVSVMKGVALSQLLFESANARHVGDLDLLMEDEGIAERLPKAMELLGEAGFVRVNPKSRLTPRRIASYVSFWKDLTFRNAASGFELDLHWRLFNNRFHPANGLLGQASYQMVRVFGVEMRVFSLRDQFLYIAAHGVQDAWTYLKSLADVAAFLRRMTPAEVDDALMRAEELGLLAQISAAVHLANDWMGSGVDSPRLLPPGERVGRSIRERTTEMLLKQDFRPMRDYPSPAEWLRLEMALVPGVRSAVEIARRFVWRPRVWASVDLPDRLFWMYPVLGLLLLPRPHPTADS